MILCCFVSNKLEIRYNFLKLKFCKNSLIMFFLSPWLENNHNLCTWFYRHGFHITAANHLSSVFVEMNLQKKKSFLYEKERQWTPWTVKQNDERARTITHTLSTTVLSWDHLYCKGKNCSVLKPSPSTVRDMQHKTCLGQCMQQKTGPRMTQLVGEIYRNI